MLAAVIVVNAAFLFIGLKIDFSVLIYAVLGPLVVFYTVFYSAQSCDEDTFLCNRKDGKRNYML